MDIAFMILATLVAVEHIYINCVLKRYLLNREQLRVLLI